MSLSQALNQFAQNLGRYLGCRRLSFMVSSIITANDGG